MTWRAGTAGVVATNGDLDPLTLALGEKETADPADSLTRPPGSDALHSGLLEGGP